MMRLPRVGAVLSLVAALAGAAPADAQYVPRSRRDGPAQAAPPTAPPPGRNEIHLARIDDGVFELEQGTAVDLTDRMILLYFNGLIESRSHASAIYLTVAGQRRQMRVGQRLNIKTEGGLSALLKDKDECFLDLVDLVAARGGTPVATLRFFCL